MLFKNYFWLTLVLELCKSGCVNKISQLFRSRLCMMPFSMNTGPINKKSISASGWDLMLSSVYFMLMESEAWRSSLGYKTLLWELGHVIGHGLMLLLGCAMWRNLLNSQSPVYVGDRQAPPDLLNLLPEGTDLDPDLWLTHHKSIPAFPCRNASRRSFGFKRYFQRNL